MIYGSDLKSMAAKRSHQDPDYEDVSHHEAKRQKVIEKDAKEATKRKIEDIIKRQFNIEMVNKETEANSIDKKLNEARLTMDKLRACIVATYFASAGQQKLSKSRSGSPQQPSIHPEVKNVVAEPFMDLNTQNMQSNSSTDVHLGWKTKSFFSQPATSVVKEEPGIVTENQKSTHKVPLLNASSSINSLDGSSRFKMKKTVVVGNVSRYIPNENREENDQSTHKWMVYVRGTREEPRIDHFIQKVWFFLHPSYRPNDLVEICEPPFHLTRRGWGEFPIRIQLHFKDSRNKRMDVIHKLKLDKTYTGLQTLGAETVVEIEIQKEIVSEKCDNFTSASDTVGAPCVSKIVQISDSSSSSNTVKKHDIPPLDIKHETLVNEHENAEVPSISKSSIDSSKSSCDNLGAFVSCESGSLIQKFTSIKQEIPTSNVMPSQQTKLVNRSTTSLDSSVILTSSNSTTHAPIEPVVSSQQCLLIPSSPALNTDRPARPSLVLTNNVKTSLNHTTIPTSSVTVTNIAKPLNTSGSAVCSTTNSNTLITCIDAQGKLYLVPQHVLPQLKAGTYPNTSHKVNIAPPATSASSTSLLKPTIHSINGQVMPVATNSTSNVESNVIKSPQLSKTLSSSIVLNNKNSKSDVLTPIPFPGNGLKSCAKSNIVPKLSLVGGIKTQQPVSISQGSTKQSSTVLISTSNVVTKTSRLTSSAGSKQTDKTMMGLKSLSHSQSQSTKSLLQQKPFSLLPESSIKENTPVLQTVNPHQQTSILPNAKGASMLNTKPTPPGGHFVSMGNQKYAIKMLQESKNNATSSSQILLVPCLSDSTSNQVTCTFKPHNLSTPVNPNRKLTVAEQLKIKYAIHNKNKNTNKINNSLKNDLIAIQKMESHCVKQSYRVNAFKDYLSLWKDSEAEWEESKMENVLKNHTDGKEKKIIVCKKQYPVTSGQNRTVIERIRLGDYADIRSLVKAAVKQHPIVSQHTEKHLFPYCARTQQEWLSWNVGKRRASEWHRASDVRKFIQSHLDSDDSFNGEKLWSTKQIMAWCRLHAYSPHYSEKRTTDSSREKGINLVCCKLSVAVALSEPHSDKTVAALGDLSKKAVSERKQEEKRNDMNILPLHPSEINTHTNIEDINSCIESLINSLDAERDSDGDVDIISVEPPKIKIKKKIKEETDTITEHQSLTEESLFVHDVIQKIGVKINPTQDENLTTCVTGDIVYVAMLNFMEDVLRDSFSQATKNRGYPSEIFSEDVYRAVNLNKTADFLTNKHLGVSENKINYPR